MTDPATVVDGVISVVADDGVVVYVNGVEIGRRNLPTGTLTQNSVRHRGTAHRDRHRRTASSSRCPTGSSSPARTSVAASTHLNYRSSIDASFDLRFSAKRGTSQAPGRAGGDGDGDGCLDGRSCRGRIRLRAAIDEYVVSRDGTEIARVNAPGTSFTDTGLDAETTYSYSVVAVDGVGRQSAPGTAQATTPSEPTDPNATLVAAASQWRWQYISAAWNPAWNQPGFDDSSWSAGGAPLGFGSRARHRRLGGRAVAAAAERAVPARRSR